MLRALLQAGLIRVKEDKDSFVITDEVMTTIASLHNFEILGDVGELPEDEHLGWHFLKEVLVIHYHSIGKTDT